MKSIVFLKEFVDLTMSESSLKKGLLTNEAIAIIVDNYAVSLGKGRPEIVYVDGLVAEDTFALYVPYHARNLSESEAYKGRIVLSRVVNKNDLFAQVWYLLHELQHYNQHMKFEHDLKYRVNIVSRLQIKITRTPELAQIIQNKLDPYEISWFDLIRLDEKLFGYNNSYHEKDADRFANEHVDSALAILA